MKTLKIVSFMALAILLLQIGLTISIPFRFPDSRVAWDVVISSDLLLAILCALLFILSKLKKNNRLKVIFSAALISFVFTSIGWTPWIVTAIFIVALFGIYRSFTSIT